MVIIMLRATLVGLAYLGPHCGLTRVMSELTCRYMTYPVASNEMGHLCRHGLPRDHLVN